MKRKIFTALACAALCSIPAGNLRADGKDDISPTVAAPAENNIPISQEFDIEGSYSSDSEMKQGAAHHAPVGQRHHRRRHRGQ
jgi:hypothetical protein